MKLRQGEPPRFLVYVDADAPGFTNQRRIKDAVKGRDHLVEYLTCTTEEKLAVTQVISRFKTGD